jgi:hypothetical protein
MASLRGTLSPDQSAGVTRLGHRHLTARADTWNTFGTITLAKDGSGTVEIRQNGAFILSARFSAESAELPHVEVRTVGDPGMSAGVLE